MPVFVMLYLKLFAELSDHRIVDICTIVRNDPLWYTVSTDHRINRATAFLVTVAKEAASTHFVK